MSRVAAKLGLEGLTVVALVGKARASAKGKLFLRFLPPWVGHLVLVCNQMGLVVNNGKQMFGELEIIFAVLRVLRVGAFRKQFSIWTECFWRAKFGNNETVVD